MNVSPAKYTYTWHPWKCDYRTDRHTDRRRTKRSLYAAMLRRRRNKTGRFLFLFLARIFLYRQKGGDLTQSYDKSPYTNRNVKRAKWQHKTTPQKSSIKQQLRTDLGRSVGVTTATQLVWLTGLRAHLPTPRNSRVIKRTHT